MKRFIVALWLILILSFPVHATITSETTKVQYTGNGVTTVYAYPFRVLEDDDLLVIKTYTATGAETVLVLNTDYTVSGAGGLSGGNVTLTSGSTCPTGYTLTILRNIELTQETDYVDGDAFSAESIENALDKMAMIQQQQNEAITRAWKLPKTSALENPGMPNPSANDYIGWNASATGLENKAGQVITTATQYEIDALVSYGGGTAYTQATIEAALTAIGTVNKATLLLRPGTWVISSSANWSAYTNVTFKFVHGVILSHGAFTLNIPNLDAGEYQVFSGTGTVTLSKVPYVRASWFNDITFGTSIAAGAQTNNQLALQGALTSSVASGIPMSVPSGTILINDDITSTSAFHVESEGYTKILQTAAGKYIFVGGTSGAYTYDYLFKNMQLATASGSYDCIKLTKAIQVVGENVLISGSGRYGWYLDACQEMHLKACHNNGYVDLITGQNGVSNGVWGDGVATGGGFYITGATTTLQLDGCDFSICTRGIINESAALALKWNGTAQGMIGKVISGSGSLLGFDIDAYLDGFGDTPGGIQSIMQKGRINLRNSDLNGIEFLGGSNTVTMSGQINRITTTALCRNIKGENIVYNMVTGGGYIKDLSPDGEWVNCTNGGGSDYIYRGKKDYRPLTSIFPNRNLERWNGTAKPCGWSTFGGATLTKTGTGLADTEKFSGDFAVKAVGNVTSGIYFSLHPISLFTGKYVTVTGRYKSSDELYVLYARTPSANPYETVQTAGSAWAKFEVSIYIDASTTGAAIKLQVTDGSTVYFDDLDVLVDSYDIALPQVIDDSDATPSLTASGAGFIPITFWKFNNSGATNVTTFDNGYGGLEYTLILDANTTLVNGATMKLRGAANKTGADMVVKLIYDSENDVWYQSAYESDN